MRVVLDLCLRLSRPSGICWASQILGEEEGYGTNALFSYAWSKVYNSRNSLTNITFYCTITFFFPLFFSHFSLLLLPFLYYPLTPLFSLPSLFFFSTSPSNFPLSQYLLCLSPFSSILLPSSLSSIMLPPSPSHPSFPLAPPHPLSRYYAICCQPLVYRNKMTPLHIALMLGGCWVIPLFISFLPIMQGWNNVGIIDLVSTHADPTGLLSD